VARAWGLEIRGTCGWDFWARAGIRWVESDLLETVLARLVALAWNVMRFLRAVNPVEPSATATLLLHHATADSSAWP
jgi:hypothetical protein